MWYNFWHFCPTIHCLFSKRVKTDNKPKYVSIIKCSLNTWTDMNMDTTWKTGVIISISCHKVMIMISMTADQLFYILLGCLKLSFVNWCFIYYTYSSLGHWSFDTVCAFVSVCTSRDVSEHKNCLLSRPSLYTYISE